MSNIDIRDIAYRLLHPNEILDVRLFDFCGRMYPNVRQQLLANVDFAIAETIGSIKELKVKDIFLNGSSASYFYHEKSDIDIRIEVYNDGCPYLPSGGRKLGEFLRLMSVSSLHNFNFAMGKRRIDISIKESDSEIMGLYSILNDKWVQEPNQHIADNLNIDDVMNEYYRRYDKMTTYLKELQDSGKIKTKEGIDELVDYYHSIFDTNTSSIKEYVVYKLLGYKGIFKDIKQLISDSRHEFLSLK